MMPIDHQPVKGTFKSNLENHPTQIHPFITLNGCDDIYIYTVINGRPEQFGNQAGVGQLGLFIKGFVDAIVENQGRIGRNSRIAQCIQQNQISVKVLQLNLI